MGKRPILRLEQGIHKMSLAHHEAESWGMFREGGNVGKCHRDHKLNFSIKTISDNSILQDMI